jgi:ABC-type nitrate/sulfonate/bicarbonate transport system substrate-binding protein
LRSPFMMKQFLLLGVLALSPVFGSAKTLQPINVCYQEYREEMVTAALQTGEKKKFFEEAGFKVNWIKNDFESKSEKERQAAFDNSNFNKSSKKHYFNGAISEVALLQSADSKKCDFVSTTFEAVLASKVDLNKMVPVTAYRYGEDYDTHLVVRKDSTVKSLKDLKGKTIRINQIGSIIPFENMLKAAGVSPDDISYKKVALADLPRALDSGEVDAVLSYNPTIPLLLGSGRVRILEAKIFSRFYGHYVPHSLLVVNKEFMATKKVVYEKFMKVVALSTAELSRRPENVVYSLPHVSDLYTNPEIEKSLSHITVSKPLMATEMDKKAFFEESKFVQYATILKERGFLRDAVDLSPWRQ